MILKMLALVGAFLLFTTAANAQVICDNGQDCKPTGGSGSPTTQPGEPFQPSGFPSFPCCQGGPTPTVTSNASGGNTAVRSCGEDLGSLRRVRASAIRGVGYGDSVDVIPICTGGSLEAEQSGVQQLHAPIGQNETLVAALQSNGFAPSNVVGVVVNDELVILYVH